MGKKREGGGEETKITYTSNNNILSNDYHRIKLCTAVIVIL